MPDLLKRRRKRNASQLCKPIWGPGPLFALVTVNVGLGTMTSLGLTSVAVSFGPTVVICTNTVAFFLIARPQISIEMFISQYTGRDCIDIWKIRPFLSHIGYVNVCWQIMLFFLNQVDGAFILHYLLVSFERPMPFYMCGAKSSKFCGFFRNNLTVNEDCTRKKVIQPYCKDLLYKSYTEYEYWENDLLDNSNPNAFIVWEICVTSLFFIVLTYFCVFKRNKSLKYFVLSFTFLPLMGYLVLAMGAMVQLGIVQKFEEVMDAEFNLLSTNYRLTFTVVQVLYALKVGSGVWATLAATADHRAPGQSNATVLCLVACCFNILATTTTCMFFCTYSYVNKFPIKTIMEQPMHFLFVKIPRLFYDLYFRRLWLILFFGCNFVSSLSINSLWAFCLLELISRRFVLVREYPGLFNFFMLFATYLLTLPLISNFGINKLFKNAMEYATVLTPFMMVLQNIVFVFSYGISKFTEDMHFLQGTRPNLIRRVIYGMSLLYALWAFFTELSYLIGKKNKLLTWIFIGSSLGVIIVGILLKLAIGLWRHNLMDWVRLDPDWGPRSDLLRRSRQMFSAQAITKEFVYRQNQLQAGILARQKRSNVRNIACCRSTRELIPINRS